MAADYRRMFQNIFWFFDEKQKSEGKSSQMRGDENSKE